MIKSFLSLGSNLGNKDLNIKKAIEELQSTEGIDITMVSGCYDTLPEGGKKDQPPYINSVVEIITSLTAHELLQKCEEIEKKLGRTNKMDYTPRTIDIDIVFYGDDLVIEDDLTIPHPLMHERLFVLEPLCEIAPDVVHPIIGKTAQELLDDLQSDRYGLVN